MSCKHKVFVVDDHPMICQGLKDSINAQENLIFEGFAHSISEALEAIERANPDILILDLSIGNRSGLELLKDLKTRNKLPLTLVLSIYDELIYAERCIKTGARGYVMKIKSVDEIISAIQRMLKGEVVLSPEVAAQVVKRLAQDNESPRKTPATDEEVVGILSDRELHVFELIGQGHSVKRIADFLNLSVKTVETYRMRILQKLGVPSSAELTRKATLWVERQGVGNSA